MRTLQHLTKKEFAIMKVIWEQREPFAVSDISGDILDMGWHETSIYPVINTLIKKKYLRVAGKRMAFKAPTRLFEPTLSAIEYSTMQLHDIFEHSKVGLDINELVSNLVQLEDIKIKNSDLAKDKEIIKNLINNMEGEL